MVEPETLVGRIKAIDTISENDIADKVTAMKKVFDEYAGRSPIVHAVIEGEITFLREYQKVFDDYDSGRVFRPYSLPEDLKKKVADLEVCIGSSPLIDSPLQQLAGNPVGLGALGAIAGSLMIHIRPIGEKPRKIGRREFIYSTLIGAAALGTAGAMIGSFPPWLFDRRLEDLKQNAIYLDNIYAGIPKR